MASLGLAPGVRARVTAVTALVVALSMLALTAVVGYGVERTLVASTSDYLEERVEAASASLARGDLEGAVDTTGPVVLQVLDADGSVLASSVEALRGTPIVKLVRDLYASGGDRTTEKDDEPQDDDKIGRAHV